MSKDTDIEDLLGSKPAPKAKGTDALKAAKAPAKAPPKAEPAAPAKAAKAKAEAKVATPAKKAPKAAPAPTKKAKAKAEPVERAAKDPIEWADGEKEKLTKKLLDKVRKEPKGINSKDTAEHLGISTRKQRPLLYSLQRQDMIVLKAGDSPVAGMTIKIGKAGK